MNYSIIEWGQSNACGQALNPIAVAAVSTYTFSRVHIWVIRSGIGRWEVLTPSDNTQNSGQSPGKHGIEPYIGYLFEQNYPDDHLYIIKYAVGGSSLASSSTVDDWCPTSVGKAYSVFVNSYLIPALASSALSCHTPLGLFWLQGETDSLDSANANAYCANLSAFFNALIAAVPAIASFQRFVPRLKPDVNWTYRYALRQQQVIFCNTYGATIVDTDFAVGNPGTDHIHYCGADLNIIAKNLFRAMTGIGDGTFVVSLTGSSGAPTNGPAVGVGLYSKNVDGLIAYSVDFAGVDTTGASGNMIVTGWPFIPQKVDCVMPELSYGLGVPAKSVVGRLSVKDPDAHFYSLNDNSAYSVVPITAGPSKYLTMTGFYFK